MRMRGGHFVRYFWQLISIHITEQLIHHHTVGCLTDYQTLVIMAVAIVTTCLIILRFVSLERAPVGSKYPSVLLYIYITNYDYAKYPRASLNRNIIAN
jgi:hypothetical protein